MEYWIFFLEGGLQNPEKSLEGHLKGTAETFENFQSLATHDRTIL